MSVPSWAQTIANEIMKQSQVWYESDTHQVSIDQAQQGFYAVNLYRKEDGQLMIAAEVYADSFDQDFESWKAKLLTDYPQLADCFYPTQELDDEDERDTEYWNQRTDHWYLESARRSLGIV